MFLKFNMKSSVSGGQETKVIVAMDQISCVMETAVGSSIVCKNGDVIPVKEEFKDVEKMIKQTSGGSGHTLMV